MYNTVEELGEWFGMAPRTVKYMIAGLRKDGLLIVSRRRNRDRTNHYRINTERLAEIDAGQGAHDASCPMDLPHDNTRNPKINIKHKTACEKVMDGNMDEDEIYRTITKKYGIFMDNDNPLHVVLLHGYGANAQDLEAIGALWQRQAPGLNLKCYAFDAPLPCPGNPFGHAWYPLETTEPAYIRRGLDYAVPAVMEFLDTLPPGRIVLAGFSQGGNVALDTALHDPRVTAAVVYSGYFTPVAQRPAHTPPVLWVHGSADQIVPHAAMVEAKPFLEGYGCRVHTVTRLNLGHTIDEQGLEEGLEFLKCFT